MPNENELISGSLDKIIKLWKLGTATNINRGFVHTMNNADRIAKNPCKMTFVGHKVNHLEILNIPRSDFYFFPSLGFRIIQCLFS